MDQIKSFQGNHWVCECDGAWGSQIVLAAKPQQEHIDDIKQFVWWMCVSYRGLNKVTKIQENPIPRCDMAITIFQTGSSRMWIITIDTKQGYHQFKVRDCDIEKLTFFGPDHKKYAFKVMPFGPVNSPIFYTSMMGNFREEWDALFIEAMSSLAQSEERLDGELVTMCEDKIFVGADKLASSKRCIINHILICSSKYPCYNHLFRMCVKNISKVQSQFSVR